MIIKSVRVKNFRSILDETLPCEDLTVLVGPNGSGKSSFLRALELFYSTAPSFAPEDFYAEDTNNEIEITITFTDLIDEAEEHFKKYVEDGDLTVGRVLSFANGRQSATYHGSMLQHPSFSDVRNAGGKRDVTSKYNEFRAKPEYAELPAVRSADAALAELANWEEKHADQCERMRDDGQFFGFKEVAQGYLGRYSRFLLIPAVRDASEDAADSKGSPITYLMDLVIRSILANKEELVALKEDTQKKYEEIIEPVKEAELRNLSDRLAETLKTYVPDAGVNLEWMESTGIEIPLPRADVKLVEDGYASAVLRTGHGLQRAFILTLLQHLAVTQTANVRIPDQIEETEPSEDGYSDTLQTPNLILGIEEPELYQHPNRQRHLAKILLQLANGEIPGVARQTQIVYGTHSPLFVGIDRIQQVRLLRKKDNGQGQPKVTNVIHTKLEDIADILWKACGCPQPEWTAESLRSRLQAIMTPWMCEGFFAEVVVLVEGETDRAAILGTAYSSGVDLESMGISVIPCMGKCNLDRPFVIFQKLDIPTYVIWDGDEGGKDIKEEDAKKQNRYLLRLLGQQEEDWPCTVDNGFACFKKKMDTTLYEEIGEDLFNDLMKRTQDEFGIIRKDQALKNPHVIQRLIEGAKRKGKSSRTIENIIEKITGLKSQAANPAN